MSYKAPNTTPTTTKAPKGLQYADIVKAQDGVATNRQTGAKTYAQGYEPKTPGNYAVKGANAEMVQDVNPNQAITNNGVPNYGTPSLVVAPATPPIAPEPQIAPTAPLNPQEALAQAKATGEAPQDPGEARAAVSQFMPTSQTGFYKPSPDSPQIYNAKGEALSYDQYVAQGGTGKPGDAAFADVKAGLPSTALIDQQLEQDPAYQQLLSDKAEFNSVINQNKSLTDEYTSLTKKLGINSLNTELMNMKNIIDGTDEDIRNEVTKSGGFATESQVAALGVARNKQLIKNYNNLLETKSQAMESLNTMMGLASQDRSFALQAINQKMNIDQDIAQYSEKMRTNAASGYDDIIKQIGYNGLYLSLGGDTWHTALVEKTLGLPNGGLKKLAEGKGEDPKAVKFETVTIGSGKGNVKVRYGYDAQGNIVSKLNLNTGQPFNSAPQAGATYRKTTVKPKPKTKTDETYGPPVPKGYKAPKAPAKKNTIDDLFNSL